jgi:hypothetical protein
MVIYFRRFRTAGTLARRLDRSQRAFQRSVRRMVHSEIGVRTGPKVRSVACQCSLLSCSPMAECAHLLPGLGARLARTAMLLALLAVQPWVVCPVACLVQHHQRMHTGHHHTSQPCHDGQALRVAADGISLLDNMYPPPAPQVASVVSLIEIQLPVPHSTWSHHHPPAEPPPPRNA